jgi:hypothetical protein
MKTNYARKSPSIGKSIHIYMEWHVYYTKYILYTMEHTNLLILWGIDLARHYLNDYQSTQLNFKYEYCKYGILMSQLQIYCCISMVASFILFILTKLAPSQNYFVIKRKKVGCIFIFLNIDSVDLFSAAILLSICNIRGQP